MHRIQHEVLARYEGLGAEGSFNANRLKQIAAKAALAMERNDRLRMIRCLAMFKEY
jgi:tRNA A37 N6-isopentenylltransferase MiaA